MPKTPDPELETRIVAAAVRLLDGGGEQAITMRSVAAEAGTTTPTLYERFRDRDALMRRVVEEATRQLLDELAPLRSVEQMFEAYLRFNGARPLRFDLTANTFGTRLVGGEKMPVFDLAKSRIGEQLGIKAAKCQDVSLAVVSLLFGTMRGMIAAGIDTHQAKELKRTSLSALRILLAAFSERQLARKRAK
jgi:AcrR family transcriptional regulator